MPLIKAYKLILGQDYLIGTRLVKLIKPTEKGYNFLDPKTNKCVFKSHMYPEKSRKAKENDLTFLLPSSWIITESDSGEKKFYLYDKEARCYFYGIDAWENGNWGNSYADANLFSMKKAEEIISEYQKKGINILIGIK